MNLCIFTGRITHELELRNVGKEGAVVLNFSIAVNRSYKRGNGETVKETDFFDFEAWDSGAQTIHRHFKKGSAITLICSARNEKYEDKDGKKVKATKFRVDRFEFPLSNASAPSTAADNDGGDDDNDNNSGDKIPF